MVVGGRGCVGLCVFEKAVVSDLYSKTENFMDRRVDPTGLSVDQIFEPWCGFN